MNIRKTELTILIPHKRLEIHKCADRLLLIPSFSDTDYIKVLKEHINQLEDYIKEYNTVKYDTN